MGKNVHSQITAWQGEPLQTMQQIWMKTNKSDLGISWYSVCDDLNEYGCYVLMVWAMVTIKCAYDCSIVQCTDNHLGQNPRIRFLGVRRLWSYTQPSKSKWRKSGIQVWKTNGKVVGQGLNVKKHCNTCLGEDNRNICMKQRNMHDSEPNSQKDMHFTIMWIHLWNVLL